VTANGDILMQDGCGHWLHFCNPRRMHVATELHDVPVVLEAVDAAVAAGIPVAGFISYEAAGGVDSALVAKPTDPNDPLPLVWFGEYQPPKVLGALPAPPRVAPRLTWETAITAADYAAAIARIKAYIVAGDTYQVNFTIRMHCRFDDDPYTLFYGLQASQQSDLAAFVDLGDVAICSASPELFFAIEGDQIVSRPMKGTTSRGTTAADDDRQADALRESPKNRAENVMIVDMIRNDLGRIADPGSVQVTRMFDIERYPTVSQMTSTVEAQTKASFAEVIHALFPCASITGAPKVRTMQIIGELEASARSIYTGCVGYWLPERRARFNVAIRTVLANRRDGIATYGVGGGIVWDSVDSHELTECVTKAEVLNADWRGFQIIETLLWQGEQGFYLEDRHVARAGRSATRFGFVFDEVAMRSALDDTVRDLDGGMYRIRCLLSRDGALKTETVPVSIEEDKTWRVGVVPNACTSTDVFLYHKTTRREVYEQARSRHPDCDDVLLLNERGEITESTIANVVVEIDGERLTPPVSSGLLAGTFREELLEQGQIREAVITPEMLKQADALWLINSVRKWMPALWIC
jgi:para-aminobenzoate synthetase/4-amino-4-deoxychorismate lyase